MQAELENLGVNIMLSTDVPPSSSMEGDAVTGVRVDGPDGNQDIHGARRGAGRGRLRRQQRDTATSWCRPSTRSASSTRATRINTGDGMTMAKADASAALYDDCWVIPNVIVPVARAYRRSTSSSQLHLRPVRFADQALEGGHTSDEAASVRRRRRPASSTRRCPCHSAWPPPWPTATRPPTTSLFDGSDAEVTDASGKGPGHRRR